MIATLDPFQCQTDPDRRPRRRPVDSHHVTTSATFALLLAGLTVIGCSAQRAADLRQSPNPKLPAAPIMCGTMDDLARRVEVCASPLMDILEGTIQKWPRNEADAEGICNSFMGGERCMRDAARKCAKGIQKAIISTLANSVQRARKRECTKSKVGAILKAIQCVEKHQSAVHSMIANITSRLDVVEKQMVDLDKKMSAVCCMVNDIEKEIKVTFEPFCPSEGLLVSRLYRAVLEDVIELICRSPKCNDTFRGYKIPKSVEGVGIVAIVLRIVFSLG